MKFVLGVLWSKTNKEKSTEKCPPFLLKPLYTCVNAMPRAKKRSAIGSNFKEEDPLG